MYVRLVPRLIVFVTHLRIHGMYVCVCMYVCMYVLCMDSSSPPHVIRAPTHITPLIWSPEWYLLRSTNRGRPYYVIFSALLLRPPSQHEKRYCPNSMADNKCGMCQVTWVQESEAWTKRRRQQQIAIDIGVFAGACALWRSSCKFPFEITARPPTCCSLFTRGNVNAFIGRDFFSRGTAVSRISSHTDRSHLLSRRHHSFLPTRLWISLDKTRFVTASGCQQGVIIFCTSVYTLPPSLQKLLAPSLLCFHCPLFTGV
jgi:hypothetical protein